MTAPVDMAALPPVLVVPGLAVWLGIRRPADEPDDYDTYLQQLSQGQQ